ncbi:MAG: DMT family transporter [Dehalococcoidia bacterium]|nr:DMT family transporter [Dehalococcoidia bacterium]
MVFALALAAAIFWGFATVLGRMALFHLSPTRVTVITLGVGAAFITLPAVVLYREEIFSLTAPVLLWIAVVGILQYTLGRQLALTSSRMTGVSRTAPFFAVAPVFAAVLAVVFVGEMVSPPLVLGIACVVFGSILLAADQSTSQSAPTPATGASITKTPVSMKVSRRTTLIGAALALAATASYGTSYFVAKLTGGVSAMPATGLAILAASFATLPYTIPALRQKVNAPGRAYWIAALSAIASFIGLLCLFAATSQGSVVKVSTVVALNPLVSIALGQILLRRTERLTWLLALAVVLMLGGAIIVVLSRGG